MTKIPKNIFAMFPTLKYLGELCSFSITPTEVPAITIKTQCPIEYAKSISIPKIMFPLPATKASIAARIGVAQGDDNTPPKIPKKKAPIAPVFFLGTLQELVSLLLITPTVFSPIKTIMAPRIKYHNFPPPAKNLPSTAEATPKDTKVNISPRANIREYFSARFLLRFPLTSIYPITKGTVDSKQGLKEETIPAIKEAIRAINIFPDIRVVKLLI